MQEERSNKIIANWVFVGVAMLIIQVLIGGITRLSGSGLSITEWKPIMGAFPPSSETEWQQLFLKYQQIAQYKYINNHFNLSDFKFIFFWEWFHQSLGKVNCSSFCHSFCIFHHQKTYKTLDDKPLDNIVCFRWFARFNWLDNG